MVLDKRIIGLELDKIILKRTMGKCKVNRIGSNSLNNRIKGALNKFAEVSKDYRVEHCTYIGDDGSVLKDITGDEYHVAMSFNDYIEVLDYQLGDLTSVHNHVTPFGEAEGNDLSISTIFSEGDVLNLFDVDTIGFDSYDEDLIGTGVKSVTCQCSNGSRMTLTRLDGSSTDNIVVDEYFKNNGDVSKSDLYKRFVGVYRNLEQDYIRHIRNYEENVANDLNQWVEKYDVSDFGSPENIREAYQNYDIAYAKEVEGVTRNYARNDKDWNNSLEKAVRDFKELGFEFSMEWL